jgi:hypothetical protein
MRSGSPKSVSAIARLWITKSVSAIVRRMIVWMIRLSVSSGQPRRWGREWRITPARGPRRPNSAQAQNRPSLAQEAKTSLKRRGPRVRGAVERTPFSAAFSQSAEEVGKMGDNLPQHSMTTIVRGNRKRPNSYLKGVDPTEEVRNSLRPAWHTSSCGRIAGFREAAGFLTQESL